MEPEFETLPAFVDYNQLCRHVRRISRPTLWRWERDGKFPQRIRIGGRNFWRKAEVIAWAELQAANDGGQSDD